MWRRWSFTVDVAPPSAADVLSRHSSSRTFDEDMVSNAFSNPMHYRKETSIQSGTPEVPSDTSKPVVDYRCRGLQLMWHRILLSVDPVYVAVRQWMRRVRAVVRNLLQQEVSQEALPKFFPIPRRVKIVNAINTIALAVLVPQLIEVSDPSAASEGWMVVGWILEVWFWVEMTLRAAAMGFRKHFRSTLGIPFTVNVASLVFMAMVQRETFSAGRDLLSVPFLSLLIVQCSRFTSILSILSDANNVTAVAPLFIRVTFIIFCWMYIFSVFGHNRFCNMLRTEEAANNDDVAPNWIPYEHQLNFHTFASSMYTMFEIATFGDWSVVQVAAKVSPASSYLFFYTYRFVMSLIILPIMSSFIIQAFITRSDSSNTTVDSDSKGIAGEYLEDNGDSTERESHEPHSSLGCLKCNEDENESGEMCGDLHETIGVELVGVSSGGSERSHSGSSQPEVQLEVLNPPTGTVMKLFEQGNMDGDGSDDGDRFESSADYIHNLQSDPSDNSFKRIEKSSNSGMFEDIIIDQSSERNSATLEPRCSKSHTDSDSIPNIISMTTEELAMGSQVEAPHSQSPNDLSSVTSSRQPPAVGMQSGGDEQSVVRSPVGM